MMEMAEIRETFNGIVVNEGGAANEYTLDFDPEFVMTCVLRVLEKDIKNKPDLYKLIQIGVERGNNLENILKTSKPEFVIELKRLIKEYYLVSKANKSKNSLTLSRICDSFPLITCSYIRHAINPTVSVSKMQSMSRNYPTVMMTSAFTFLIPNKNETFCMLLKKAHMLHQYEFFDTIRGNRMRSHSVERNRDLINDVMKCTNAAIEASHITYDTQMEFLKEHNLITTADDNIITVSEEVLEAVEVWGNKLIEYYED
ncbi:Nucleocapsid, Phlebovirus/Tenuivirus [Cinara cedri]|uniref:Nucleocapsid, Phlebovirus/Tenuivirus n=1 Tax=Cinara cedri TaxID=506608 RepID=A0A5E4M4E9_9HEMI|nr:Nucleocapsid, Phlebovirus/Tenuivirus [Cinara cedri]